MNSPGTLLLHKHAIASHSTSVFLFLLKQQVETKKEDITKFVLCIQGDLSNRLRLFQFIYCVNQNYTECKIS